MKTTQNFNLKIIIFSCLLFCFACTSSENNSSNDIEITKGKPATSEVAINQDSVIQPTEKKDINSKMSLLGTFEFGDCTKHVAPKSYDCSCSFSLDGSSKSPITFLSNWDESACIKITEGYAKGMNALYLWDEDDIKADFKKLSEAKDWISISGTDVNYFGKPLKDYKYENAVEFLTDVILASGKNIEAIPTLSKTPGTTFDLVKSQNEAAIAKAKDYKTKGGADPLSIVRFNNRTYDVLVRTRQTTQSEGEANHYEGTITLLKNRDTEIIETKTIKGTCGC